MRETKYVAVLETLVISGSQLRDTAETKFLQVSDWLGTKLEAARLAAEEEERNSQDFDDSKCKILE